MPEFDLSLRPLIAALVLISPGILIARAERNARR